MMGGCGRLITILGDMLGVACCKSLKVLCKPYARVPLVDKTSYSDA